MPRSTSPPALLALLLLPAIHALRGAHPSNGTQLAAGVTCVLRDAPANGPVALPSSRVNDDYCDCEDGSDEPGTSACPGAVFWCRNARFRPIKLPSSWVDDGNCDCCDGSDEPKGKCPDTCAEEAKRFHAVAKQQADAIREGVALRAKYAKEGQKAADKERREIEILQSELKEIEAQLKKSEIRADGLRKRRDYEDQMRLAAEKHSAPPVTSPAIEGREEDVSDSIDGDNEHVGEDDGIGDIGDDGTDPDDIDPDIDDEGADPDDVDHENDVPPADNKPEEDAHLSDEVIKNAELENSKDDVDGDADPDDVDDEDDYKDEDDEDDYKDDYDDGHDAESEEHNSAKSEEQDMNETGKESGPGDIDVNMVCDELGAKGPNPIVRTINYLKVVLASKLRLILPKAISPPTLSPRERISECVRLADSVKYELDNKKRDIEDKLKKLKEKTRIYYGSDGALRKLHGSCIRKAVTQYEFELCPFDLVRQYEHGSSIAVLGKFKGWKGEGADRVMNYAQGDRCWNGPPRSIKVELGCGKTEEIVSVEEPNRCAYHMKFKTPAVCESAAADELLADFEQAGSEPKQEL